MPLHVACGVVFSVLVKVDFLGSVALEASLFEFLSEGHVIIAIQYVGALRSALSSASSLSEA